jgi:predicted NAD/FAD-binding protein
LGVPTQASEMSFAFSRPGFEYAGRARGLLADPATTIKPRLWRLVFDIARFYRRAPALLGDARLEAMTLDAYLAAEGYSRGFVEDHMRPMAAAIWSADWDAVGAFPMGAFVRFFANHGLLRFRDRPRWRTVAGGSLSYVDRIAAAIRGTARLASPVLRIHRAGGRVWVATAGGVTEGFDDAVLAVHAPEALAMIAEPNTDERRILGAFRYAPNRVVLHGDDAFMPRRRAAWSSWNAMAGPPAYVTYWMNRLQSLPPSVPFFVSVNPPKEPRPVYGRYVYAHPQYDTAARAAQLALPSIQGRGGLWFCGAYCGDGFHEDGLEAGLAVAAALGAPAPWAGETPWASPAARAVDAGVAVRGH